MLVDHPQHKKALSDAVEQTRYENQTQTGYV